MALTARDRQQLLAILIVVAVGGGVLFWMFWRAPRVQERTEIQVTVDSLEGQIERAKADLRSGTVERLRQRVAGYEASLDLMRQLVPSGNDVPKLIDDIASSALGRGVKIGEFTPLSVEPGAVYVTHRYRYRVVGHYDEIGEFLTDVASLPQIMVPYDLQLSVADQTARRAFADTTSSLLEANFQLRTFVKPQAGRETGANQ